MRNLLEGVQLDSYHLPWGCPRPRVEALLRERAVPVEVRETERLLLRSRMLGAPLLCDVGLGFRDGTLSEVGIAARAGPEEAERAFSTLQARLESLLGQRGKAPPAQHLETLRIPGGNIHGRCRPCASATYWTAALR